MPAPCTERLRRWSASDLCAPYSSVARWRIRMHAHRLSGATEARLDILSWWLTAMRGLFDTYTARQRNSTSYHRLMTYGGASVVRSGLLAWRCGAVRISREWLGHSYVAPSCCATATAATQQASSLRECESGRSWFTQRRTAVRLRLSNSFQNAEDAGWAARCCHRAGATARATLQRRSRRSIVHAC